MADDFQRVEPTPFETPQAKPASQDRRDGQPPWLWPALGALLLLALLVIFALPRLVEQEKPAPTTAQSSTPAGDSAPAAAPQRESGAAGEPASPFADALEAKARAAAQELLQELLTLQESLVERGAEEWGAEAMAGIAATADAGDTLYRERDFEGALARYEEALASAQALEATIPERAAAAREAARGAIEALEEAQARTQFALAEQLEPGAEALLTLSDRLETLPQLTALATGALDAETSGDLQAAVEGMTAAAALDKQHEYVAAEARRLREALTARQFSTAMSDGYAALEGGAFDDARAAFERAARLRPGAAEAAAALQELAVAETAAQLQRLKGKGEALIAEESWAEAIPVFEEALAIDRSLRFAREGLALARPRAALSKELSAIIDEPGRLVDDAILAESRKRLDEARAISNPGPKLAAQIEAAAETIRVASQPVRVVLQSDGETSVTVYKVARLGQFAERELSLRPGRYTAVGMRRGYRDVRREFTVGPDGTGAPIVIACTESI